MTLGTSSVYAALRRLQKRGMIRFVREEPGEKDVNRNIVEITPKGLSALDDFHEAHMDFARIAGLVPRLEA